MLIVATMLWDANGLTYAPSRCYDESWVVKLRNGFARHLTVPHRFVCFTDRPRSLPTGIEQEPISCGGGEIGYGWFNEPYRLTADAPVILVALDTVVVGNIDHWARYCFESNLPARHRDRRPKHRDGGLPANGIQLIPQGWAHVFHEWVEHGATLNDTKWLMRYPGVMIEDLWPGELICGSDDEAAAKDELDDTVRVVFMWKSPKQPDLMHLQWCRENWR